MLQLPPFSLCAQSEALVQLQDRGFEAAERGSALLGYVVAGPCAGVLLATRSKPKATLPGGHTVYAVTDSQWVIVPLLVSAAAGRATPPTQSAWLSAGRHLPRPVSVKCPYVGCAFTGCRALRAFTAERGRRRGGGRRDGGAAPPEGRRRVLAGAAAVHPEQRALLLRDGRHLQAIPQVGRQGTAAAGGKPWQQAGQCGCRAGQRGGQGTQKCQCAWQVPARLRALCVLEATQRPAPHLLAAAAAAARSPRDPREPSPEFVWNSWLRQPLVELGLYDHCPALLQVRVYVVCMCVLGCG